MWEVERRSEGGAGCEPDILLTSAPAMQRDHCLREVKKPPQSFRKRRVVWPFPLAEGEVGVRFLALLPRKPIGVWRPSRGGLTSAGEISQE